MRYHIIALVVFFSLLFYLLDYSTEDSLESIIEGSRVNQEFDYYMTSVDSTRFSHAKGAEFRLQADRVVHYPSPETTTIEAPRLTMFQNQTSPWLLSASYGRIEQDLERNEEKLELSENVVVQHTDTEGNIHNIYTEELTIFLNSQYLSTESDVLLESENTTISSQGMTADLINKHIIFLTNARGRYD